MPLQDAYIELNRQPWNEDDDSKWAIHLIINYTHWVSSSQFYALLLYKVCVQYLLFKYCIQYLLL